MPLGLVQLVVQCLGHIRALRVAVWAHTPVFARLGLHADQGIDGWLDDVFHGRRDSQRLLLLQQLALELVAVVVIHLLVRAAAPNRLVLNLFQNVRELVWCHGLAHLGAVFGGIFVVHGVASQLPVGWWRWFVIFGGYAGWHDVHRLA